MRFLFILFSRSPLLWPALLALVFLLVGCGSTLSAPSATSATSTPALSDVRSISTPATRTYLGEVSGTRALLGIVLDGASVRAYACDGTPKRLATLSEWFVGQMIGGRVQASSLDKAQLTAQLTGQSVRGTLALATGHVYTFSILQVPTTQVGVFEGKALFAGQRYHAGWLVLPGRPARGGQLLSFQSCSWADRDRPAAGISRWSQFSLQSSLGERNRSPTEEKRSGWEA